MFLPFFSASALAKEICSAEISTAVICAFIDNPNKIHPEPHQEFCISWKPYESSNRATLLRVTRLFFRYGAVINATASFLCRQWSCLCGANEKMKMFAEAYFLKGNFSKLLCRYKTMNRP